MEDLKNYGYSYAKDLHTEIHLFFGAEENVTQNDFNL